jgi:beta-N-acetylhexosaminidase
LITKLQRTARRGGNPSLLVSVDQEGGTVKRLPSLPPDRAAREMGSSPAHAEREGQRTGRALRRLGVNVNLAPVADVPRLRNHFLGSRAFSRNPRQVASAAAAFTRGLRAGGLAATAKHFPGLGWAKANTDLASVKIGVRRAVLRSDYVAFRAVRRAGAELVMLSNAAYPALDRSGLPAAMSRRIVQGELRGAVGFRGVTISDSLATPAIQGVRDRYVKVANAGTDILLFASEAGSRRGYARLWAAAKSDTLNAAMTAAAASRIRALKDSFAPK